MSLCVGIAVSGDSVSAVVASADTLSSNPARLSVPPVLVITPRGAAVGMQAEQLAASGVGAVFRDFTGRVGDPVPVVGSDGSARLGADLVAMTIGGILRGWVARSGLAYLTIVHPSGWGPYETSVLHSALTCTEAEGVPTSLVSGPNMAVTAAVAAGVVSSSETVIVVDSGGSGTEVALVSGAKNHVGRLEATSRTVDLGSIGLDHMLARHILEQVRGHLPTANLSDPANRAIVQDVVATCRRSSEDLVLQASTVVDVRLPAGVMPVRVVRAEFEALVREPIRAALSAIADVMDQARKNNVKVDAIVLTGEIARMPLLTELISAQWPTRVVIPPCPEWAIASGAAHISARRSQHRLITRQSPVHPKLSNPPQPRSTLPRRNLQPPGALSHDTPSVRSTGNKRKWTLKWGALQVTAALMRTPAHR